MPRSYLPIQSPIEHHQKVFLLAYDQGLEHGPAEFNDTSVDPGFVLDIAQRGPFTGIVLQKGVAASYYKSEHHTVPLVMKLNGRTNLVHEQDPYAPVICSVDEARDLGAVAVGYTLYLGSAFEGKMFTEFGHIVKDAHERKMPVIVWMTPKGHNIADETDRDILAYAARVALELGADYVQLRYSGEVESYRWVVESAGTCKVLMPGGTFKGVAEMKRLATECMSVGASGLTVGRNIWQAPDPLEMARVLSDVVFGKNMPAKRSIKRKAVK